MPGAPDRLPADALERLARHSFPGNVRELRNLVERTRRYLEQMLAVHHDNLTAVARAAGVDRMTVYRMLERCGLKRGTDDE